MSKPQIAAHLIVGARPEPFLPALLRSLIGVADTVIVDENSALSESDNLRILTNSFFGQQQALRLIRSTFTDFCTARNRCINLHAEQDTAQWVAFVDADEVHGPAAKIIANNLDHVPPSINFIDGYTYHFVQAFDWYRSIERRMTFHRFSPSLRWVGAVHEHLEGIVETRLAIPYLYAHYGHVLPAQRHAEKNLQYAQLGDQGSAVYPDDFDTIDPEDYFASSWPQLMRFFGEHAPAADTVIAELKDTLAGHFATSTKLVQAYRGGLRGKILRAFWRANYDLRWRSRWLDPRARRLLR